MAHYVGVVDARALAHENRLKQAALLFDRIAVVGGTVLRPILDYLPPQATGGLQRDLNLLEYLLDAGVVVEPPGQILTPSLPTSDPIKLLTSVYFGGAPELKEMREHLDREIFQASPEARLAREELAYERFSRRVAAHYRLTYGWNTVVVGEDRSFAAQPALESDSVAQVVINNMPIPDEGTPWEAILDFRSDTEARGQFTLLRRWMNEALRSEQTYSDLDDELRALLHDYESYMNLHKLKVNRGAVKTLMTIGSEVLEGLVRLKPTKIAEAIFSISERRIELLEAERDAPGREVAYITSVRTKFGKAD